MRVFGSITSVFNGEEGVSRLDSRSTLQQRLAVVCRAICDMTMHLGQLLLPHQSNILPYAAWYTANHLE